MQELESVGGELWINNNDMLSDLSPFENLAAIGSNLYVVNNELLASLSGLDNIDPNSINNLEIHNNPLLSDCDVQSICNYLVSPNGTIFIDNNAPGCNSQEEVVEACEALSCLPEGVTFSTQEQIDNFQTNHPGCNEIEGYVKVCGMDIWNVDGLNVLTSIGGSLTFYDNPILANINGLSNLTLIGGDLEFTGNIVLSSISSLENLTSVVGAIEFHGNWALSSLAGLENLTTIPGHLSIQSNGLTSLMGLANLTSVGDYISIVLSNSLTNISELHNITSIGGNLLIQYNNTLTSLTGLENVTTIGGLLGIVNNDALTSLMGLENINASSISDLTIIDNDILASCEVQSVCEYLADPNGVVSIYNNATGCNNPAEIADNCEISMPCLPYGNYYFYTQSDIDNFQTNYSDCLALNGQIEISGEDITNINGLNVVTHIGGNLGIIYNDNLLSLSGLENIDSIEGFLQIGSDALTNLSGLESLTTIGGELLIGGDGLTSLTGLNNLTSVGIMAWIGPTENLSNLVGLESLTSVGEDLQIFYNMGLTNLSGIENIESSSINWLSIHHNPFLSSCEVESVCESLTNPNTNISIHDNAPGCNSQQEVEEACASSINEVGFLNGLSISPNPFSTYTTIEYELAKPSTVQLTIYNYLGKQVEVIEKKQSQGKQQIIWNAEGLPAGVYFCVIKTNEGVITKKIIKL